MSDWFAQNPPDQDFGGFINALDSRITHLEGRMENLPGSSLFYIDNQGRVGIGTTEPSSNLHIKVPGSSSPISALTIDVESFGAREENASASHYFRVRDMGSGLTPFYIGGDGSVGIGTTSPGTTLKVNGDIAWTGHLADMSLAGGYSAELHNERGHDLEIMVPSADSICFLTRSKVEDVDDFAEWADCSIYDDQGMWVLSAALGLSGNDADVWREAYCVQW